MASYIIFCAGACDDDRTSIELWTGRDLLMYELFFKMAIVQKGWLT